MRKYAESFMIQLKNYWPILIGCAAYFLIMNFVFPNLGICAFRDITGYPCPTCGMTRAYEAVLSLDFASAFYYHPLWPLVPVLLFIFVFAKVKWVSKIAYSKVFWLAIVGVFLIVYVIRMITVFPNDPLTYNPLNLFEIIRCYLF